MGIREGKGRGDRRQKGSRGKEKMVRKGKVRGLGKGEEQRDGEVRG